MLLPELNNPINFFLEYRTRIILARLILLSLVTFWIYGFLQPMILSIDHSFLSFLLSRFYSNVCHQETTKCISIGSTSMLVCARCAGIYSGAFISGLFSLMMFTPNISRKVLILSIIPMGLDVFFTMIRLYSYSQAVAFSTGLVFGSIVYLIIISELDNLTFNKVHQWHE